MKTIGWALLCLLALIIVVPISFIIVGILSRNDSMHIPDPETDEELKLLGYIKKYDPNEDYNNM